MRFSLTAVLPILPAFLGETKAAKTSLAAEVLSCRSVVCRLCMPYLLCVGRSYLVKTVVCVLLSALLPSRASACSFATAPLLSFPSTLPSHHFPFSFHSKRSLCLCPPFAFSLSLSRLFRTDVSPCTPGAENHANSTRSKHTSFSSCLLGKLYALLQHP